MITLKLIIFYGSYLIFPLIYLFLKKRFYILLILGLIFIYARFIEPKYILVNHYKIEIGFKAKYALISDIHLGIYNDESILKSIVYKVNKQDVDALLIAGDFTYEPNIKELKKLFQPLKDVNIPIYAVLGNHDMQCPGPKLDKELKEVLRKLGVNIIDNKAIKLNDITILGLGSHWAEDDKVELLDNYTKKENLVVLTHNPDTVYGYNKNHSADITFSGHTHGGQIRIPWFYKKIIPVNGEILWDQGLYEYKNHKVFVTSGVGEVGLPLRFLIPPVIDIVELF